MPTFALVNLVNQLIWHRDNACNIPGLLWVIMQCLWDPLKHVKNDKGLAASFDSGLLVNEPAEPSMQLLSQEQHSNIYHDY